MSPRTRQLVPLVAAVVACLLAVLLVNDYARLAGFLWICLIVFVVAWFLPRPPKKP